MISVLGIRPKVQGFKPGLDYRFLKGIKIPSTPFFREEVKPKAQCRNILRNVKKALASMNKDSSQGQIHNFLRSFLLFATRWLRRIARELRWTNQEFSSVDFIPPRFSMLIYHTLVAAVQICSLTPSTWSSPSSGCPTKDGKYDPLILGRYVERTRMSINIPVYLFKINFNVYILIFVQPNTATLRYLKIFLLFTLPD
jgi:hypothetical protein